MMILSTNSQHSY